MRHECFICYILNQPFVQTLLAIDNAFGDCNGDCVRMTLRRRHGVSNHRQLDGFFIKTISNCSLLALSDRNQPMTVGFHSRRASNADHTDGLVQERRNYVANTLELRLSCTNPSICRNISMG